MMHVIDQRVQVTYRYPVYFTSSLFTRENPLLRDVMVHADASSSPRKILCILDTGVYQHHPDVFNAVQDYCLYFQSSLCLVCPPLLFQGGEEAKNALTHVLALQEAVHQYGICRHSYILAIGGGALIDMAGFAAATAHRGIRLIRVPTTVLAQNDAAIGVKNGVNAFGKKNFLGTFAPPLAVFNDASFLTTLSMRDWRGGIAEAVKVALLKDAAFFHTIETQAGLLIQRDVHAMQYLIYRCAQLHLAHIATNGDPFESGSSRPLDFGHWAAHKLECLSHYSLRHGEAVAIGIALDATYSYLVGLLPQSDWKRILTLLTTLGFVVYTPELSQHLHEEQHPDSIISGLQEFREHLGGELTIPLLQGIGRSCEVHTIHIDTLIRSITLLAEFQSVQQER